MTWDMYDVLVKSWAYKHPFVLHKGEIEKFGELVEPSVIVTGMYQVSQKGKEALTYVVGDRYLILLESMSRHNTVVYPVGQTFDDILGLLMRGMVDQVRPNEFRITRRGSITVAAMYIYLH